MKSHYLFISTLLLFAACKDRTKCESYSSVSEKDVMSCIKPLNGLDIKPRIFTIDAGNAGKIDLENGGSIVFDENAFIDVDGNPVKGEVNVEWQEFHTLTDILLSGIPMKYDSAGVKNDLVSGGMFTIHATQNGNELNLAPGKSAEVNLASIQDQQNFNFYQLNEKTGKWNYETTKNGETISDSEDNSSIPKSEEKNNTTTSKAESFPILDISVNTKAFPELQEQTILGWKSKKSLTVQETRILTHGQKTCRLVKHDSLGGFAIELKVHNGNRFFPVEPYDITQAEKDSKCNERNLEKDYAELAKFQEDIKDRKVLRSIEIENFGTYNWDIICKRKKSQQLMAFFEYPEGTKAEMVSLFLISPEENAIVNYNPKSDSNFSFDPDKKCCLVAILPGNEIVSVPNEDFKKARKAPQKSEFTFSFNKTGVKLKSGKDIAKYLDRLI